MRRQRPLKTVPQGLHIASPRFTSHAVARVVGDQYAECEGTNLGYRVELVGVTLTY